MKKVHLKFVNGLGFADGVRDILWPLAGEYEFVDSPTPDFVVFGPYGTDVPPPGGPVRIGYFCENQCPDLSICDWAFGMIHEEDVGDPRYMRIRWHGLDPASLVKSEGAQALLAKKTKFCNFLYSNPVAFRERFFRELSKYKPIDAPGYSMNNMPAIDSNSGEGRWPTKRRFLEQYKFTIAFENYSYPGYGYNVEKIQDPMRAGSLPVYFGNPVVDEPFNPRSFINGHDYVAGHLPGLRKHLEAFGQPTFGPPPADLGARLRRRLQGEARTLKMRLQAWDFGPLVDEIVRIDKDDDAYLAYMGEPWFKGNVPPSVEGTRTRWREIFATRERAA